MNYSLRNLIQEVLHKEVVKPMKLIESTQVTKDLKFHLDKKITLSENIFRIYSESYFNLINEVRELYNQGKIELNDEDIWLVESNLGVQVQLTTGEFVYLDAPLELDDELLQEAEHRGKNVNLNSPFRTPGGPKKFAVYVKTPGGNIKKVTFGDPNMRVRNRSKSRAKSFTARHKCSQKKDRTTAGYWSCNVGRYAKKLGLSSKRTW